MPETASSVLDGSLVHLQERPLEALEACRAAFQQSELTRNDRLYRTLAFLVQFVVALEQAPAHERAFRTHKFWDGSQRVVKSKRLPLLAVRFVLGARRTEGALYEQARSYAKVVEFFRQNQADSYDVIDRLERRGIYALLDDLADAESHDGDTLGPNGENAGESSSDDGSDSDDASDEGRSQDSSDDESDEERGGKTSGGAEPENTSDAVGSRQWWRGFIEHAKAIHASGNVPIVIAGSWSDLDDLKRRSRRRSAKLSVSQDRSADGWSSFACEHVERARDHGRRGVSVIPQHPRLLPAVSSARDGAGAALVLLVQRPRT